VLATRSSQYKDLLHNSGKDVKPALVRRSEKKKDSNLKLTPAHGNNASLLPAFSMVSFLADAQMARQNAILFTKSARL